MYDKHFVGLDLTSVKDGGVQRPISRVTLRLDGNNAVTAGDDTGMELMADCPHATQAMVNAILAQVRGLEYQMFSAEDARLDPAAELGDGITAGGLYSVVSRIDDDGSGYSGVSAPGEAELEDEYPAGGPVTQAFNRRIAKTNSRITKTAEEIRLEVANEVDGLSAAIDIKLDSIESAVRGVDGQVSTLKQYVDGITLDVSNGSTSSTVTLKSGGITITSQTIQMNGLVTFSGLSSGTTTIDGSCIKTGTIDANRVKVSSLYGQNVYLNNAWGAAMGQFSITGAETTFAAVDLTSYGALRLTAQRGAVFMEASAYGTQVETYDRVYTRGSLVSRDGNSLGDSVYRWSDIYANNAAIQTSDLTAKKKVEYGLGRYDALFDSLRPMSFLLKDGQSGRRHLGLGAQDVEQAMEGCGISTMEFAGLVKSPGQGGEGFDYGLRYGEFIPLCIEQIQRLKGRVDKLEGRVFR